MEGAAKALAEHATVVAVKLWTDSAGLAAALATTLGEAVAGYVIGNAIGFVLAVAFFYRPVLDRLVMPLIVALNSVPAVAFAPVVILWFGVGMTSKIVLVAFITCFIALQNQLQGFRQSDLQAVNVLRSVVAPVHVPPVLFASTLASSCDFSLPAVTPPNAIVFGSGYVTIRQIAKAGLWMNLISIAVITAYVSLLG